MRRVLLGLLIGVLIFAGAVGAKVVTVTNLMSADLNAAGFNVTNAHDIFAQGGAAIEMNAQGELSLYSAAGAPGAFLAADGGSGALVQVNGPGAGFPGDVNIAPDTGANVRLFHLPTADPHVPNALWNDAGTLKVSSG